jgi:hypothetical protein
MPEHHPISAAELIDRMERETGSRVDANNGDNPAIAGLFGALARALGKSQQREQDDRVCRRKALGIDDDLGPSRRSIARRLSRANQYRQPQTVGWACTHAHQRIMERRRGRTRRAVAPTCNLLNRRASVDIPKRSYR